MRPTWDDSGLRSPCPSGCGDDQSSYLEIAELIEERSTTVTTDLRELWRRVWLLNPDIQG
jgi:hypothetical protein